MTAVLTRHTAGVFAIAPTPFAADGSIDIASLDRLLGFYEQSGVDGITVLGQLGEAQKLTEQESRSIANYVLSRSNLPVVVGVTAPGFAAMRELARYCMERGAAGVMIAPAATLRTDAQITAYFRSAAAAVAPAPFVLQDYPLAFSVVINDSVIEAIALENENLVMLKHEDWPGLDKISSLRSREAAGTMPRLSVLCGNGGLFLDYEMERGADGAMTGYCFPELLVDVVDLTRRGHREKAHDLFDAHLPLIRYEQQPGLGLAVRKFVLTRRGLLTCDRLRTPSPQLSSSTRHEVIHLLQRVSRLDARAKSAC